MTKENVLQNEAKLVDSAKNKAYRQCDEVIVFALQDNYHQFSIGISTILECLKFAELRGAIPPLPETWWDETKTRVNLP
ncbi:hypothetical protein [Pasteurella sp. PK-2025]|uniref:hypothetical protein n=1 Tax=unclassified Pasteurella TaxID=2621516 RepID=UPI003C7375C9